MMVPVYMVMIILSTLLAAWGIARAAAFLAPYVLAGGRTPCPAACACVAALAFLVVVGAPGAVLVGAIALLVLLGLVPRMHHSHAATSLTILLAVVLGLTTLSLPSLAPMPPLGVALIAAACWFTVTASAMYASKTPTAGSLAFALTLAPLVAAPLLSPAPSFVALDAAILLAAMLGSLLASRGDARFGVARVPLAYLCGWLMLEVAIHGGWVYALISALAWGATIAYATLHQPESER